jgi:hypothetical protein
LNLNPKTWATGAFLQGSRAAARAGADALAQRFMAELVNTLGGLALPSGLALWWANRWEDEGGFVADCVADGLVQQRSEAVFRV